MSPLSGNAIKYTSLNSDLSNPIRLLDVLPGSDHDEIKCRLYHTSLSDQKESFEALSYTWGDEMCSHPVSIDGALVYTTSNLEAALRCLRYPTRARTLWVDAICIHQQDKNEKQRQIKQMGLVYELAQRVVVWLGPASDRSELALEFAQTLFDIWSEDPSIQTSGHEELASNRIDWVPYADRFCSPQYAEHMVAATKLLMRSWWSRAWIVQEFLSNDSVVFHCGIASKTLGPIRGLISFWGFVYGNQRLKEFQESFLDLNFGRPYQLVNDLMHRRTEIYGSDSRRIDRFNFSRSPDELSASFLRSLSITRGRGCQYQHDRIYSVLGIVGNEFKDSINIDHKQSLKELYTQVSKCYVDITGRLDIICNSQPTGAPSTFPSWLPDWNVPRRARVYGDESRTHNIPIRAAGESRATANVGDDGSLTALGLRVGVIKSVGWEKDYPLNATGVEGPGWWLFGTETSPQFVQPLEALLKLDSSRKLLGGERVFAALLHEAHRSVLHTTKAELYDTTLIEIWSKWSYLFGSTTWNRTVFTTLEGHIGLALHTARPGDELCVLFGCSAPVVLRAQVNGSYIFVGDSFVHGIMDGETMREYERGGKETVLFTIK